MLKEGVYKQLGKASLDELMHLDCWLHDLMNNKYMEAQAALTKESTSRATNPLVGYRWEYVECKSEGCHCHKNGGHGPYLYYYRRVNGVLRCKYIKLAEAEALGIPRPGPIR